MINLQIKKQLFPVHRRKKIGFLQASLFSLVAVSLTSFGWYGQHRISVGGESNRGGRVYQKSIIRAEESRVTSSLVTELSR